MQPRFAVSIVPENSMNAKQFVSQLSTQLGQAEVQLITFAYADFKSEYESFWPLLSASEQQRALNFVFPEHRIRSVIAHAILRLILAHFTQVSPKQLCFGTESRGKPFLSAPELVHWHFNLSHTETGVAIAISYGTPVGVDIEWMKSDRELVSLAERFFAPPEAAALRAMPEDQQQVGFYRLWTYKEAVLKATGSGITEELEKWIFEDHRDHMKLVTAPSAIDCQSWSFFHQKLPGLHSMLTAAIASPEVRFNLLRTTDSVS